ncbi:hypothetical protein E3V33_00165 [Candidatus Marinimicrobia bacterium MT.SAG.4]|nr:hypothetical protein E3V33_00165 [Candidatus Marinimicrobia bacterium MT.SAG.4]
MKLICIDCGNYTYFAADIEMQMAVLSHDGSVSIENAEQESYDYTSDSVRRSLNDLIGYVLRTGEDLLIYNRKINRYENRYITCVWCGSSSVTPPSCEYIQPEEYLSIDEELNNNRNEYLRLKKEGRRDAYLLPEQGL